MKGTKTDEEEFEMLLGEIPHATSAPPHLEELQRVKNKSPKADKEIGPLQREGSNKSSVIDTYGDFYESYHGAKNLSASSVGNIHAHLPHSNGNLNSFYSSMSFGSPHNVASTLLPEDERKIWRDSLFAEIANLYQILYTEFMGRHLNHGIAQLL